MRKVIVRLRRGRDYAPSNLLIIVRPWAGHSGQFIALHNGHELCRSRSPFLSAARVLLAMGIPADAQIAMQHEDREEPTLFSTVGYAASLSIDERFTIFRKYSNPRTRNTPSRLTPAALKDKKTRVLAPQMTPGTAPQSRLINKQDAE
jgi:hypothetical protein